MTVRQRSHQAHVHVDMRAAHNRTDNAFNGGFDAIDRQIQSACEIIAGADGHDAEWFAGAADCVGA